jgi:hypothetical protein
VYRRVSDVASGRLEVLQFLRASGVNAGVVDGRKRTAMHLASERGDAAVLQVLLQRLADLNAERATKKGTKVRTAPCHLALHGAPLFCPSTDVVASLCAVFLVIRFLHRHHLAPALR